MDKARETIAEIVNSKLFFGSAGVSVGDAAEISVNAADAILAAMPEIIKGMVQPLEWSISDTRTAYSKATHSSGIYCIEHRLHGNTEFDLWIGPDAVTAQRYTSLDDSIAAANAHNAAQVLKELGMGEGE